MRFELTGKRIWVAGASGMVGQAICRRLESENLSQILTPSSKELDLRNQTQTLSWLQDNKPDAIFMAAAKVGGIMANSTYPAQFLYDNLMITANVIHGAYKADVAKLLFLGSSCIYPKLASQPLKETSLMTGPLEPTNAPYAVAKISGIYLCESYRREYGCNFISAMPTNLYGAGDNYHPENAHVIPALIHKAHQAKITGANTLTIWGSGTPLREFLQAEDCADALIHVMKNYNAAEAINIGSGKELSIGQLARKICDIVGFKGKLEFDTSKPDGTPRKLMSSEKLRSLGWSPKIDLITGLRETYKDYLNHKADVYL